MCMSALSLHSSSSRWTHHDVGRSNCNTWTVMAMRTLVRSAKIHGTRSSLLWQNHTRDKKEHKKSFSVLSIQRNVCSGAGASKTSRWPDTWKLRTDEKFDATQNNCDVACNGRQCTVVWINKSQVYSPVIFCIWLRKNNSQQSRGLSRTRCAQLELPSPTIQTCTWTDQPNDFTQLPQNKNKMLETRSVCLIPIFAIHFRTEVIASRAKNNSAEQVLLFGHMWLVNTKWTQKVEPVWEKILWLTIGFQ